MTSEYMDKEKWVLLFREIGLDDGTMVEWHQAFETRYPTEHQSFLEWLKIPGTEIAQIRAL